MVETLAFFSAPQTLPTCFRSPLFVPEEISALGSVELQASIRPQAPQAVNISIWALRHAGYMRSYDHLYPIHVPHSRLCNALSHKYIVI